MGSAGWRHRLGISERVLPGNPLPVGPGGNVLHPIVMIEIPLHGFAQPAREGLFGAPSQFALDFTRVDGVAAVAAPAGLPPANPASRRENLIVPGYAHQHRAPPCPHIPVFLLSPPPQGV